MRKLFQLLLFAVVAVVYLPLSIIFGLAENYR